jgi:hypothetical protein
MTAMALNKQLYRFLSFSAFVMCGIFILFAFILYRSGGNYWTSIYVAVFELIAGLYLLKKSS